MTREDRVVIACLCNSGETVAQIARAIGFSRQAVYSEIRKGTVASLPVAGDIAFSGYDYEFAQRMTDLLARRRGRKIKIEGDRASLDAIEGLVRQGYSPYAALVVASNRGELHTRISFVTLYRYIHGGILGGLEPLLRRYRRRDEKPDFDKRVDAASHTSYRSISERPLSVLQRLEFGHWEGDTVVGARGSKECLFTLVERKTRYAIAVKIPDRTQGSVIAALNSLERVYRDLFRKVFKTITFDNGVEFYDVEGMKRSQFAGTSPPDRIGEIYFAHPYCSSERGSNENMHRFIRRAWPKGTSWGEVDPRDVVSYMEWVNEYPRGIFAGRCARDLFSQELAALR